MNQPEKKFPRPARPPPSNRPIARGLPRPTHINGALENVPEAPPQGTNIPAPGGPLGAGGRSPVFFPGPLFPAETPPAPCVRLNRPPRPPQPPPPGPNHRLCWNPGPVLVPLNFALGPRPMPGGGGRRLQVCPPSRPANSRPTPAPTQNHKKPAPLRLRLPPLTRVRVPQKKGYPPLQIACIQWPQAMEMAGKIPGGFPGPAFFPWPRPEKSAGPLPPTRGPGRPRLRAPICLQPGILAIPAAGRLGRIPLNLLAPDHHQLVFFFVFPSPHLFSRFYGLPATGRPKPSPQHQPLCRKFLRIFRSYWCSAPPRPPPRTIPFCCLSPFPLPLLACPAAPKNPPPCLFQRSTAPPFGGLPVLLPPVPAELPTWIPPPFTPFFPSQS